MTNQVLQIKVIKLFNFKKIITLSLVFIAFFKLHAGTIIVQNVSNSGAGSLRQAVIDSQDGDTIRFNPSLLSGGSNTIVLMSEINFFKSLVFKGLYNSTDTLYISGNTTNRIFFAELSPSSIKNLVLDSLVLIDGNVIGPESKGGAVFFNNGYDLVIRNSILKNNSADWGGAIFYGSDFSPTTITVENSIISNNSAAVYGGGIYASPNTYVNYSSYSTTLTLINSTMSQNNAAQNGGAIYTNCGSNSSITLYSSTLSENSVAAYGGGIYSHSELGVSSVSLHNSTINDNSGFQGGAIFSLADNYPSSSSILDVNHSTITGNTANYIGGIYSYCVNSSMVNVSNSTIVGNTNAGVHSESGINSSLVIKSSIVALNTSWDAGNVINNTPSPITSAGFNIFGVVAGAQANDQLNVTASQLNLGSLQWNGGNTKTMLPGLGSVAINMGDPMDLSAAQNIPLTDGMRDVGAAEVCATSFSDSTAIECGSFNWYGTIYTTSGNFTRMLTNLGGCDSIVTLHLTINSWPNANITNIGNSTLVEESGMTIGWLNCANNELIPAATESTYTPISNGSYAAIAYNPITGCSDTSACVTINDLGLDLINLINFEISPNPTNDFVTLLFDSEEAELIIYDINGKQMSATAVHSGLRISLENVEIGLYFFVLEIKGAKVVKRIVKS